ncbi:glycosyltransferase family A protein [Alteraurantiacibacter aquimixticola]|uniref:Glycosyltransferase family 2 protein n=1 Tax=Alteraurantiacibacter aquimixticola TaxID=2489173 RepID=A0A4T3EZ38_9SPHN|nr:glycosyltransferase family A protein [Alteraurantiacibacter aquimixticola]TIX49811.1 glycosyltransferase family 2 protein [Alteraurantiacibacter aquimixticola]
MATGKRISESFLAGPGRPGLVSVVMPAFNREMLVADALDSLAAQDYRPLQIIVVDEGSSDATASVVLDWASKRSDLWVDLVRQSHRGAGAARNAGLMRAHGEFIYFLDSDDVAAPYSLSLLAGALQARPDRPFAAGHAIDTDLRGREISDDHSGMPDMRERDVPGCHWPLFTALYRRCALRQAGPFNDTLKTGGSLEMHRAAGDWFYGSPRRLLARLSRLVGR